jgi:tRNA modification GTPase
MTTKNLETIVALATPPGRGGVAIVRISGSNVLKIARALLHEIPKPRYALFTSFNDHDGLSIDQGLALYFVAPNSFTGEDVLELHCHGGSAVIERLIKRVLSLNVRLAKPGEFSERAFLNDKIDLIQAEAIADLIDASSEQAARSAMRSLQGEFSKKINDLVERVIKLRMYIEAAIDFVEEEVDFLADKQIQINLNDILHHLLLIQASAKQGSLLRDGITAVIAGKPNAGKSSLLNQLSGKDTAIVTHIAGTTRDLLREYLTIDGMPIHIIDTAGLRESEDLVEQEGVRRAYAEIAKADVVLFVVDATETPPLDLRLFLKNIPANATIITIRNKIDLLQEKPRLDGNCVALSAKQGIGIDLLKNHIKTIAGYQTTQEGVFSARQRHLDALDRAKKFLLDGKNQLENFKAGELLAEDLRQAQLALNEITGEFSSDDLLGRIFSSFCIGK